MNSLHPNQQKILDYLLGKQEGSTIDELVVHLGISKTAVKEHLIKIERFGLVTHKDQAGSVGRPKRSYFLTDEGQEAFPKQYAWLTLGLLGMLADDLGKDKMAQLMSDLADKVAGSLEPELSKTKSNAERLQIISKVMNDLGYKSILKSSDVKKGAILEATNCVYHSVAKQNPELCRFDIRLLETASGGMNVKLESCIARGGSICRFCIKKQN